MPATSGDGAGLGIRPAHGISLDIGVKHAVGYFMTRDAACDLTVVLASATDGEVSLDSPGTRVSVRVVPGALARIDAAGGKTAEFACGPGGQSMSARVLDRPSWSRSS